MNDPKHSFDPDHNTFMETISEIGDAITPCDLRDVMNHRDFVHVLDAPQGLLPDTDRLIVIVTRFDTEIDRDMVMVHLDPLPPVGDGDPPPESRERENMAPSTVGGASAGTTVGGLAKFGAGISPTSLVDAKTRVPSVRITRRRTEGGSDGGRS